MMPFIFLIVLGLFGLGICDMFRVDEEPEKEICISDPGDEQESIYETI